MNENMAYDSEVVESKFFKLKHVKYCLRCLEILPERFSSLDSTRLIVAFFAVSGLDLLDSLSSIEKDRIKIIEWVYSLQIIPDKKESNLGKCGFLGSTSCLITKRDNTVEEANIYDMAHMAMTYAALTTLLILGDDLSRVNRKGIILGLQGLQLSDGSFRPLQSESENDMRFIYCAACICYILQDWSGMDVNKAIVYIKNSMSYDGGISQGPGLEAHAGSTFCAVAAVCLMGRLKSTFTAQQIESLCRWCIFRQQDGFQGRPNKLSDTCYSFWIGATLKLLGGYQYINYQELVQFVFSSQNSLTGGIGKWNHQFPDPLHTYLGIGGLSLTGLDGTSPVDAALNISQRAVKFLSSLHQNWEKQS